MIEEIYKLINRTWLTQNTIVSLLKSKGLNLSTRHLRELIRKNNLNYADHKAKYYIVHDNANGYHATNDYELIMKSLNDLQSRANDMQMQINKTKGRLKNGEIID